METVRRLDGKGRVVLPKRALEVLRVGPEGEVVVYVVEGAGDPAHVEIWNPRRWFGR